MNALCSKREEQSPLLYHNMLAVVTTSLIQQRMRPDELQEAYKQHRSYFNWVWSDKNQHSALKILVYFEAL